MATVGARLLLEGEGLVTGTGDFVNVLISNSGNGHASEKRFARGITVADLKVYETPVSFHTCLEAPRGVKKFAKDTNPLGPSRGSIQSILGHF